MLTLFIPLIKLHPLLYNIAALSASSAGYKFYSYAVAGAAVAATATTIFVRFQRKPSKSVDK